VPREELPVGRTSCLVEGCLPLSGEKPLTLDMGADPLPLKQLAATEPGFHLRATGTRGLGRPRGVSEPRLGFLRWTRILH
jgi:hypothetical protein